MADSNQIIGATIQVDTGSSNENVSTLKKNLTDVKGALNDTSTAAKAAGKDIEGAGGSFGKIKEQMAALPGPIGEATEGVGKLNTSFKALLANPVVLILAGIVAVLATLYKSFTNTFEGGEKVEQIFAGIKAVAQSLFDNLDKIASSIGKLFTFDFSGAVADMKAVGDAASSAYSKMASLTKESQDLHREQLANDLDQANRAKQLAVLREQANDETIPVAKRKAALLELKAAAEQNAKDDIDLAKRTTANKIAQLTIEKDGALKNQDEINASRIQSIQVQTDNANELRRIDKQLTAANKAEEAERVANAKDAADKRKAAAEQLAAYQNTLLKLQQENSLLQITDGYQKELQALANKIDGEKAANAKAFADKKLTRAQYQTIDQAITLQGQLQRDQLTDKHNAEIETKEAAFQKELADITTKTRLDGITNSDQLERAQLQIGYEQKLQDAIKTYKDDAIKFQAIKTALQAQMQAAQDKLDAKNKLAKEKADFKLAEEKQKAVIASRSASYADKLAAVNEDQKLVQKAFDDQTISEQDYTAKMAALANDRTEIRKAELKEIEDAAGSIGGLLGDVSEAVGANTAAGKAFAIAAATIKALQTEISIISGLSEVGPFGFVAGIAAAAAVGVELFSTIKKIESVQVPGGASSSTVSIPSPLSPVSAPISPTASTTSLSAATIGNMGNAAAPHAFVLDSDIASNRDRDVRLNRASRLG